MKQMNVVVIGGGTGIYPVTAALRQLDFVSVTTIVAVSDSGGSSGRIRDEFGFQPVGDLRQSLAALAEENGQEWIRKLLLYRFEKGEGLKGHNLGNLILTALQDMTGTTSEALFRAQQIFRLEGKVIPATEEYVDLKIVYQDGTFEIGEDILDDEQAEAKLIDHVELTPQAEINEYAAETIEQADLIIIGPGDLYASLIAALAANGTKQAFANSRAKVMYISNLMTRKTQTQGMSAHDHCATVEEAIGKPIDIVLLNSGQIPASILAKYEQEDEYPIIDDLKNDDRVIKADIIQKESFAKSDTDTAHRSVLRHDSNLLRSILATILEHL